MGARPQPVTRSSGFTLVELLVVIGIIVLLIGISLPALSRLNAAAQRTKCLSNLKQIGVGLAAYRIDHRGNVPEVASLPVDSYAPSIITALEPYLSVARIWHCPSDADDQFAAIGTSYEYFLGYYFLFPLDQASKNQLIEKLENMPSLAFVMIDAEGWHGPGPGGSDRNALYLDGHAGWLAME